MKNIKKSIFTLVISIFTWIQSAPLLYAVPGINQLIPLTSGEYVYYRDSTFSREAVFGIIFYDEATYGMRFYAPATKTEAEKDISVYISINPENPLIEFTGERIVGAYAEEDAEIINYLHDIFYEFSSRRQKTFISGYDDATQTIAQEYEQFGGEVNVNFDAQIPIFNIRSISNKSGKKIIYAETIGKLSSNQDTGFSSYKGILTLPQDKKRNFKNNKKAKNVTLNFENTEITIRDEWTEFPGYWFLGDYAMLSVASIPLPTGYTKEDFEYAFEKMTAQSSNGSYALLDQKIVKKDDKGRIEYTNIFYQPENGDVTRDFKILIENNSSYAYLTLTVFDSIYKANKKYFNDLLSSFKIAQ